VPVNGRIQHQDMSGHQTQSLNQEADIHKVILRPRIVSQSQARSILIRGLSRQEPKAQPGKIRTAGLTIHRQTPIEGTIHHQILLTSIPHRPIIKAGLTPPQGVILHQVIHRHRGLLHQATLPHRAPHHQATRHPQGPVVAQDHPVEVAEEGNISLNICEL
jgi:hypothetical protein